MTNPCFFLFRCVLNVSVVRWFISDSVSLQAGSGGGGGGGSWGLCWEREKMFVTIYNGHHHLSVSVTLKLKWQQKIKVTIVADKWLLKCQIKTQKETIVKVGVHIFVLLCFVLLNIKGPFPVFSIIFLYRQYQRYPWKNLS